MSKSSDPKPPEVTILRGNHGDWTTVGTTIIEGVKNLANSHKVPVYFIVAMLPDGHLIAGGKGSRLQIVAAVSTAFAEIDTLADQQRDIAKQSVGDSRRNDPHGS